MLGTWMIILDVLMVFVKYDESILNADDDTNTDDDGGSDGDNDDDDPNAFNHDNFTLWSS